MKKTRKMVTPAYSEKAKQGLAKIMKELKKMGGVPESSRSRS